MLCSDPPCGWSHYGSVRVMIPESCLRVSGYVQDHHRGRLHPQQPRHTGFAVLSSFFLSISHNNRRNAPSCSCSRYGTKPPCYSSGAHPNDAAPQVAFYIPSIVGGATKPDRLWRRSTYAFTSITRRTTHLLRIQANELLL